MDGLDTEGEDEAGKDGAAERPMRSVSKSNVRPDDGTSWNIMMRICDSSMGGTANGEPCRVSESGDVALGTELRRLGAAISVLAPTTPTGVVLTQSLLALADQGVPAMQGKP